MKKIFLFILLTQFIVCKSQTVFNLDFETEIKPGFPAFWRTNLLFDTINYKFETSSNTKYSGLRSLKISNSKEKTEQPDFWGFKGATVFMDLSTILPYLEKEKLGIQLKIKITSLDSGYAEAYLSDLGEKSISSTKFKYISGDWASLTIQPDSIKNWKNIYLALSINGRGTVYFDDIKIGSGNNSLEDLLIYPDTKSVGLLSNNIHEIILPSLIGKGKWIDGMLLSTPKIIALGESTHGTHDFFYARSEILKALVLKKKIIFAFETDMSISDRVNSYLNGNADNSNNILNQFGPEVWKVNELKNTLEWIRAYNISNPKNSVLFFGNDIATSIALRNLINFCKRNFSSADFDKANEIFQPLWLFYSKFQYQAYSGINKDSIDFIFSKSTEVEKYLQFKLPDYEQAGIKKDSLKWLLLNAKLVNQTIENKIAYARERYMADNMSWINKNYPDYIIVWWAHTSHTGRYKGDTGDFLNSEFGNSYVPIGFYTATGNYSAEPFGKSAKKLTRDNVLEPAVPGTLEYMLQQKKLPGLVMNVKQISNTEFGKWLNFPVMMRNIGSRPATGQFIAGVPHKIWDYVIFINESSGTTHITDK